MPSELASCHDFSFDLAASAADEGLLDAEAAEHFHRCLRCQAELVQYKKLRRALASLRGQLLTPDEYMVEDILAALKSPGSGRLPRLPAGNRKVAYIGGIAAAATAGAAGALVLASRLASRQQRLAS